MLLMFYLDSLSLQKAFCSFCHDRIWGLGRQGFKCVHCKLMVHKKCHKLFRQVCTGHVQEASSGPPGAGGNVHSSESSPSSIGVRGSGGYGDMNGSSDITILSKNDISQLTPSSAAAAAKRSGQTTPSSKRRQGGFGQAVAQPTPHSGPDVYATGDDSSQGDSHAYSLKDFELLRVIGRGSYAKVLMVELKSTRRIYAMKVIKKELVTDEEDMDWVQTEKHVFETASNYPFLVGLHSCFQTKSR